MSIEINYANTGLISQNYDVISNVNKKYARNTIEDLQTKSSGKMTEISEEELRAIRQKEQNEAKTLNVDNSEIINNFFSKTGDNITWDKDGNVTERTVNLNEIDPQHCNSFDMYAYSCYASESGKCPNATSAFMMSHAYYRGELGGGSSYEDLFKATDWLAVVKDIMDMQYQLGNLSGYMKYKGFFDFLGSK